MSELDDRMNEAREAVATMDPPEDLWARVVARASSGDAEVLDLPMAHGNRRRFSLWLTVAACVVAVVAVAVFATADRQAVDTIEPAGEPSSTTTTAAGDSSTTLARGEDVKVAVMEGGSDLGGHTLNITAVEQDGEVNGELRVGGVLVTLECANTRMLSGADFDRRDLILGGEVTDSPDGLATLDDVNVAVGDGLALIIREDEDRPDSRRVTLYHPSLWYGEQASVHAGSCEELVASVPANLDDGYFDDLNDGGDLETAPFSPTLASGEGVEIVDHGGSGGLVGHSLNIHAERKRGVVTGEIRVDKVVVKLQCADTDTIDGEIRLGGEVTQDPDGQGLAVIDGRAAIGDRVALIIRERGPDYDQVTFYANDTAGTCTELVDSFPYNLDGGYFSDVAGGDAIETSAALYNP
ncbi:MAG: hypothetical protein QOI95_3702 [Acidimicrobiaceae bacterium]|jgi:hypothetical protein